MSETPRAASPERRAPDSAGGDGRPPGSRLVDLVEVMDTLRVRCPWDARQTHESLAPHLLEETYEAIDALSSGEAAALREELGDVLLQVVFHARVAQERTDGTGYTVDDVADGIISKLTRRHPHVFGDVEVAGPDEVKQNWDAIKAAERAATAAGPVSALDGVPMSQPALSLAAQLLRRAGRAGAPDALVDPDPDGRHGAPAVPDRSEPSEGGDIGAQLFDLVAQAVEAGIDAELELRAAARSYADRVREWEAGR